MTQIGVFDGLVLDEDDFNIKEMLFGRTFSRPSVA